MPIANVRTEAIAVPADRQDVGMPAVVFLEDVAQHKDVLRQVAFAGFFRRPNLREERFLVHRFAARLNEQKQNPEELL